MAKRIHTPIGRALAVPALGTAAAVPLVFLLLAVPQFVAAHFAAPPATSLVSGGGSVHVKNGLTPDWMIELMAKQAHQSPPPGGDQGHGYWI